MGIFKDYYDIGKNETTDKFLQALKAMKSYIGDTLIKNEELLNGAMYGFHQGKPAECPDGDFKCEIHGRPSLPPPCSHRPF